MSKTRLIGFKATDDEVKEIERICKTLQVSKADFLRAAAFNTRAPIHQPQEQPQQPAEADLEPIKAELSDLRQSSAASAAAFETLLQSLNEFLYIPSFREYRARDLAEGTIRRDGEAEISYLKRLANRYYIKYAAWPDPANMAAFGPVPKDTDLSQFPARPGE